MKKTLLFGLLSILGFNLIAQSIKGPESISYFQAPSEGVKYAAADIYLLPDRELQQLKLDEAKNNPLGMANNINLGGDIDKIITRIQQAMTGEIDDEGKFDTWNFVPNYIIAQAETNKNVIVEIFFLNETDPAPSTSFMDEPQADKDGYYKIHYYINCRYTVSTPRGEVIMDKNLGVISGDKKSLTPPTKTGGSIGSINVSDEKLTIEEKIGINEAIKRVRTDIFAHFGFGQFSAPIKLGVVKEIKESKKMIKPMLELFQNKAGLLLNENEKAEVQKFVDVLEKGLNKASDKTRWVAYHNLSVCYAWLEEPEKAKETYTKYGEEISETLDKFRRWDLAIHGKLPKDQRKGLFIGGKDKKKFNNYRDIENFVNYYAAGAKRYEKLFYVINRDLKKFVDAYAHNDMLCQLYEIDFPYQFFPLNRLKGEPKSIKGTITKEGMEPIEYVLKFDGNHRLKSLETSQVSRLGNGEKEKLISRKLQPIYNDKTGRYIMISDPNKRGFLNSTSKSDLKKIEEPLTEATYCYVNNITKNTGFWADKTSSEKVQLKVDLDGNMFYEGSSSYFKMNAIFKELLTSNGIEAKRSDTKTTFTTAANITKEGLLNKWSWDGLVETNFGSILSSRTQSITADKMLREIEFVNTDKYGNPTQIKFNFVMNGKLNVEQKISVQEFFKNYYRDNGNPQGEMTEERFHIENSGIWDCKFTYDENGNWTEMKIGPYTASRIIKY